MEKNRSKRLTPGTDKYKKYKAGYLRALKHSEGDIFSLAPVLLRITNAYEMKCWLTFYRDLQYHFVSHRLRDIPKKFIAEAYATKEVKKRYVDIEEVKKHLKTKLNTQGCLMTDLWFCCTMGLRST